MVTATNLAKALLAAMVGVDDRRKVKGRSFPMQMGPTGFFIDCVGCGRRFESRGLRCCSPECETLCREREETRAIMAGVEMDAPEKKRCFCGRAIPKWRKGRKVSAKTRFCSPKCAAKSRRGIPAA
jgi:hypothetical protein